MKKKRPKFKAVIEQPIHVRIKGDNTYYTCKSMKRAEALAKEIVKEAERKWEEENSKETLRQKRLDFIQHNVQNYVDHLKKQLWHNTRELGKDSTTVKLKKKFRETLKGILTGTIKVEWHQSYFDDSTSYSVEKTKDYER